MVSYVVAISSLEVDEAAPQTNRDGFSEKYDGYSKTRFQLKRGKLGGSQHQTDHLGEGHDSKKVRQQCLYMWKKDSTGLEQLYHLSLYHSAASTFIFLMKLLDY